MKKLIAIIAATFITVLGAAPASAATPEDCVEADEVPPGVECPVAGEDYPLVEPGGGTVPEPEPTTTAAPQPTTPPQGLPATGSSGVSGVLQIGALLVTGGLLVLVASRRRSSATA